MCLFEHLEHRCWPHVNRPLPFVVHVSPKEIAAYLVPVEYGDPWVLDIMSFRQCVMGKPLTKGVSECGMEVPPQELRQLVRILNWYA